MAASRQRRSPRVPKRAAGGMSRRDAERLAKRVREAQARLQPRLPDMDPGDLALILERMLRPPGSGRRFFLHRRDDGGGFIF